MSDLSKRLIIYVMVIILASLIALMLYSFFILDPNGSIKYNDCTIDSGHYGKTEKYDPSNTIEGYKGSEDSAYYIYGKISCKKDKKFTLITFNLYDQNNKLLGTAISGINKIKKDTKYSFKALSLTNEQDTSKINHYKLKDIKLG